MLAITQYAIAQVQRKEDWREQMQEAEKMARRALEIDPSEAKACNVLGNILNWRGHHDDSVPYIESAIKLNPSFAAASTARAFRL